VRTQKHNQGKLKELTVSIEEEVYNAVVRMADNAKMPVDELVVIALKRFRSSHADYDDCIPKVVSGGSK